MLTLKVRSIVNEAFDINSFELVHPRGEALPRFTAGSHIDVWSRAGSFANTRSATIRAKTRDTSSPF
jgi:ferredoxin-NADP reductase